MSGKAPHEAVRNFLDPIQLAVSCVSSAVVRVGRDGYRPRPEPHSLILADNRPVTLAMLDAGEAPIAMVVGMFYRIVETDDPERGPWKISTAGYNFELLRLDRRLFAYHWHPDPPNRVTTPHLHLSKDPLLSASSLGKLHIPTGRVSLEEVIRLALEMGVKPQRDDCEDILTRTQRQHELWRTWGGTGTPRS